MAESSPQIRASDLDRDRVAGRLQQHFAQGRLDVDEFNERVTAAYQATTRDELARITEDLPGPDLADLPGLLATTARPRFRVAGPTRVALIVPWLAWAGISTVGFLVWLVAFLAGGVGDPWFLWMLGTGAVGALLATLVVVVVEWARHRQ